MRIAVCSDIHLEFGPITLENNDNADVLVLSGDIFVARDLADRDSYNMRGEHDKSNKIHAFFEGCCTRFPHVVYIMGNHEHYHGDFSNTIGIIRERLGYLSNLYILDKQVRLIDDVLFVGGTLWTDMNKEDPITLQQIRGMMNDFITVKNSSRMSTKRFPIYRKDENGNLVTEQVGENHISTIIDHYETREVVSGFSPEDAVEDHKAMIDAIVNVCDIYRDMKIVVCGHHAPSKLSTKPRYEREVIVNGAYSSDLSEFILDRPQIKLWTHGHTHHEFDYMIGSTRIFCNPRGYIHYEGQADQFQLKTVEI